MNTEALRAERIGMEPNDGTLLGAIAGGLLVVIAVVYRGYSKLRHDNQIDGTEAETLRMLDAAVLHWRTLYETAWKQVAKERELREKAEARTSAAFAEIENLRAEVAALRREVEKLTAALGCAGGSFAFVKGSL